MEPTIPDQDSYIARRRLFKNIWDQSTINAAIATAKSKVIKTLRLSDQNTANALKRKQEIKKLKTACTKLLKLRARETVAGVINKEQAGTSNEDNIADIHVKRRKKMRITRMKRKIKRNTVLLSHHKGKHKSWKIRKTLTCKRIKSPTRIPTFRTTAILPQYKIKRTKKRKKIAKVTTI